ncbi:MAG: DUF1330 domain-containing protein [Steroidobacteraceae bacterium]
MTAYVVFIRNKTIDPAGLQKYAAIARNAPIDKLEVLASKTCKFQMLEGPAAEAVVVMRFPTMSDALEWYNSDAYQEALPHRLASGDFRAFVVEGVN